MRINRRVLVVTYGVSILAGLALILFATFFWPGYEDHPGFDNMFVTAVIITLIPPSILDLLNRRWKRAVDTKLPEFIRDIADSQKTGMAFTKAIEHSARLEYGPLSKELRKAVSLMSWGHPYSEALDEIARRIDTPLIYRAVALLIEVGRSGGNLYEILDSVYLHVHEVQDMERDRRRQMTPYVAIIYASFGVYIFVVVVLFLTFFSQIQQVVQAGAPFGSNINPQVYYVWFFHMSVIEAIVAGFIVGKMNEGAIAAGLKHVLLLLIVSMIVFILVIQPSIS
ncbi:MAG: type II secretion system F family protein [Nitrososphaerales archaeon]